MAEVVVWQLHWVNIAITAWLWGLITGPVVVPLSRLIELHLVAVCLRKRSWASAHVFPCTVGPHQWRASGKKKEFRDDRVIGWVSSARPLGTVKPLKVYVSLPPSAPRWLITLRVLCSGLGGWTRITLLGHSRRSDSSHKLITFFHGLRSEFELYIKNLTEVSHMPSKNCHTGDAQSWEKKVCLNLILNLVNLISLFFYFKIFFVYLA